MNTQEISMTGIFLESCIGFAVGERVYGPQVPKVAKILSTFGKLDRNLGVLLSGDKGMGKSIMMKLTAMEAIKEGLPVVIITNQLPGLVDFIQSLDQPSVVLFDEFDKIFREIDDDDPQNQLLSLLDGTLASAKKLFIMSCNEVWRISDYMINRPGRLHYHIRFSYPTEAEIVEYCVDHLEPEQRSVIPKILELSYRMALSYDTLRAICFEVSNLGETNLGDVIRDLNISASNSGSYEVILKVDDITYEKEFDNLDVCDEDSLDRIWLRRSQADIDGGNLHASVCIEIDPRKLVYDRTEKALVIKGGNGLRMVSTNMMSEDEQERVKNAMPKSSACIRLVTQTYDRYSLLV
jgi:hypothetical protein